MIYPDVVENIDEYVYFLGAMALEIEAAYKLQRVAIELELLNTDQQEKAKTLAYDCARVFHDINDMLELLGKKANIDTPKTCKILTAKLKRLKNKKLVV